MISVFTKRFTATGSSDRVEQGDPRGATLTAYADADPSVSFSATVDLEVSNDGVVWVVAGTISLSGTGGTPVKGSTSVGALPWRFVRVTVSAISGTGAYVDTALGV